MVLPSGVIIKDNFLEDEYANEIENWLLVWCPWSYSPVVVDDRDHVDDFQFTHTFFDNNLGFVSEGPIGLKKIVELINPQVWLRIKSNLRFKTEQVRVSQMHTDFDISVSYTSIYFVNDNDGRTTFENGSYVESCKNRFLTFPSYLKHAGSTCSNNKERLVINFNFIQY